MSAFIVSVARTPITRFSSGALASVPATKLGSSAIKATLKRANNLPPETVQEVYFGQVLSAAAGQAPARQAALGAGLPESVICTTVNKVCASGMKAIMLAAQSIKAKDCDIVLAGGMESMSLVPRYLVRQTASYGNLELADGILNDGLTDAYGKFHMGICAENTCKKLGITREDQDNYAINSYKRSKTAHDSGLLAKEIVPFELTGKKPNDQVKIVNEDEEFSAINFERVPKLRPAFDKDGTVTAANASTLNDGAAATLLMSSEALSRHNLKPIAEIVAYADAACQPIDFPVAPALGIPRALKLAGLEIKDISRWEINEAFSAVVLANMKILNLDPSLVNVNGGAVSLGHPIGMSGARIVNSLALHLSPGQYGVASICNGGGGASTVVVKKL